MGDWDSVWEDSPVQVQQPPEHHVPSKTYSNSGRNSFGNDRQRGGGNRGRGGRRFGDQGNGDNRRFGDQGNGDNRRFGDQGNSDNRRFGDQGNSDNRRYGDQGNSDNRNQRRFGNGNECDIIRVPSRLVGKIIGRGGSQIEELQIRSQARIQVTKETEGEETIVKIFGTREEVDKAKVLIDEVTVDRTQRRQQVQEEQRRSPVQSSEPAGFSKHDPNFNWLEYVKECDKLQEAEWNKLPPIIKNFYQEHPEVSAMSEDEVERFRAESNNIVVDRTFKSDDSVPVQRPAITFEHAFHNFPEILEEIRKAGFEKPSPIQCQAWPVLMSGEDLIGIAQTGTGKTLAFLLPALIHIDSQLTPREEREGPTVLIMAPTRELALQIDKEIKKYQYRGITSVCVYGGGDRRKQVTAVSQGVDIVIATPGRMNDLVEAGHLNIRPVTYAVLDEADRMLDMGFEPQIRKVMYSLRPNRQTVMTSATWPSGVRRLASSYMKDPVQIYIGSLDLAATHTVTQSILILNDDDKEQMFFDYVNNLGPDEKMIVFCGTKARADYLSVECALKGVSCAALHGDRDQCDREQALLDIIDGTVRILVATDVASRGLDIDDITHVLNYDFPRNIEEYVHRVGRTGRAGKSGESISFFTKQDWAQAGELIKILEEAQQYVPEEIHGMSERFEAMKEKREQSGTGRGGGRPSRFGSGGGRRW